MTSKSKTKRPANEPNIEAKISAPISGQVAIGAGIQQTQTIYSGASNLSEDELKTLTELIAELKEKVSAEAPPDKKDSALEKVSELEEAIATEKPDISTMEYVRNWFVKNIPALAGAVTGLVVNPIVGKLVEAAGETIAHEFKRRFGAET